jgi:hypothetical protein
MPADRGRNPLLDRGNHRLPITERKLPENRGAYLFFMVAPVVPVNSTNSESPG